MLSWLSICFKWTRHDATCKTRMIHFVPYHVCQTTSHNLLASLFAGDGVRFIFFLFQNLPKNPFRKLSVVTLSKQYEFINYLRHFISLLIKFKSLCCCTLSISIPRVKFHITFFFSAGQSIGSGEKIVFWFCSKFHKDRLGWAINE